MDNAYRDWWYEEARRLFVESPLSCEAFFPRAYDELSEIRERAYEDAEIDTED